MCLDFKKRENKEIKCLGMWCKYLDSARFTFARALGHTEIRARSVKIEACHTNEPHVVGSRDQTKAPDEGPGDFFRKL